MANEATLADMHEPIPVLVLPSRRRLLRSCAGTVLCAAALLAGMPAQAGYNVWTGEYTIAQAELQARIESRFPLGFSYAQIFDVQVARPRVRLDAATRRVAVAVDVSVRSPFTPQPLAGLLVISSKLRFDAGSRSVRLVEPDADRIAFQGLAPADAEQLQAIGQAIAQEALQDYPVHTFRPEELRFGNRVFEPGDITVGEGGITVKLN